MASSQTLHPASFLKRKKVPCQLKKRKDLHSSWLTHWMCWRVKTLLSSWWLCVGKDWPIFWTGFLTTTRSPPYNHTKPQTQPSLILTQDLFHLLQSPCLWPDCCLSLLLSWKRRGEPWLHHLQESPSLQRQAANVYETFSFSPTSS